MIMNKNNDDLIEQICLVLVILSILFLAFKILQSNYRRYHAEMHGAPILGRIVRVDKPPARPGYPPRCKVEYTIGDESFSCYTGELHRRYTNDSLIVIYDTTNVRQSFVLLRNPKDAKSAFFKSQKDYMPLKWQQDYDKCLLELEEKRVAHREKRRLFDRFCRDD